MPTRNVSCRTSRRREIARRGVTVALADRQDALRFDRRRLCRAVRAILRDAGVREAAISLAVVDAATIHRINREFLGHDYPTDVLSFVLEQTEGRVEGELIVSADAALENAPYYGWPARDELLLYVIHGTLHLIGHDDHGRRARSAMRAAERDCLARLGVTPPHRGRSAPASR